MPVDAVPPFSGSDLGLDPTKCPGEGFKWKGKGSPESGEGAWVNGLKDRLHPDLKHKPPKGPHWDYQGERFPDVRLYPNGTWELK